MNAAAYWRAPLNLDSVRRYRRGALAHANSRLRFGSVVEESRQEEGSLLGHEDASDEEGGGEDDL